MKARALYTYTLLLVLLAVCGSLKAEPIDPYDLPQKSQDFIHKAFFYAMPIAVERYSNGYEVMMNDNSVIELDKKGEWVNVTCMEGIPESVIPMPIRVYIKRRFEKQVVTRISRSKDGYQLEMTTGVTLSFNKKNQLIKVD